MLKIGKATCAALLTATSLVAAAEPSTPSASQPATQSAATQSTDTSLDWVSLLPPGQRGASSLSSQTAVKVDRFVFRGNTRFSNERLREVVDQSLRKLNKNWPRDKQVSLDQLEEARLALSRFYVDNGYINSGAVLPEQSADKGSITFQIVEGRISQVNVSFRDAAGKQTNRHLLRRQYVVSRVQLSAGPPLNILRLKDELELLRQDPNIKSINAELKPGASAGDGLLDVQVQETNPFQIGLQFSDRRPPSVGSTALDVLVSDSDLTGHGDILSVRYDVLSGPVQDMRLAGARDFSLDYTIPITPADTTFNINFTRTDTVVQDATFARLHITSRADSLAMTLRQPVYRKPTAEPAGNGKAASPSVEFDLFLTGALRDNHTTLLGRPFSFSPGDVNGTEHITAVRFGQELTMRSESDALSGRSTFSLGVPWFDSTPNNNGNPGGRFFAWLGQAQYVRLIPKTDVQLVLRGTAQFSDRPLLTLEQFALGGIETVRGYPENLLVRDRGLAGTIEFRIPVLKKSGADIVTLVPFFDAGYGWNHHGNPGRSEALDAVGIGLLLNPNRHVSAQIYYGAALQNHVKDSTDVENLGLHFNVLVLAF